MRDLQVRALRGALAGVAATVAMTTVMKPGAARLLPADMQPREFLPKKIIRWTEAVTGLSDRGTERAENLVTVPAHLGYGALMGACYGMLRPRFAAVPAPLAGPLYGLAVWAISYQGWIPAMDIQPATTEKPPGKWLVPIGSHLVYGATLAEGYERLR